MNQVIVNEPIDFAVLSQLVRAPTSCPAHIMDQPRRLRAVAAVILPPPRQFAPDRARRPTKKPPDRPLAFGGQNAHWTFL